MEYNTQREMLLIPEYGRNIQEMIKVAIKLKDRDQRNKAANVIISVMGMMNPHLRDYADFKHKLWDHLFIISEFKLDVDSPYPLPDKEALASKPNRIPYPKNKIKYKHYGKNMETIIQEIIKVEDGEEKNAMIEKIANFMKMSYLSWNRDSVGDELILEHLRELSDGKLSLSETSKLHLTSDILAKTAKKPSLPIKRNSKHRRDNNMRRKGKM